jgi:uncharacterized protein
LWAWRSWVSCWGFLASEVLSTASIGRDVTPDILRGFALWGIILVNVAYFSTSVDSGVTSEALESVGDSVAAFLVFSLAQGKFYLIFSFLFGYSAHYVLGNARGGRRRWWLRAMGLMLLGFAHANFLFIGDILFLYGVLGLLLLALYTRRRTVILRWAGWIYALFTGFALALVALSALAEAKGFSDAIVSSEAASRYEQTILSGDYFASITARFELWISEGVFLLAFQGALTFVAFLFGILASRWAALGPRGLSAAQLRAMMGWGLGLGLGLQMLFGGLWLTNALSPSPSLALELAAFFGSFVTAPLLSVGYIGLIVMIVRAMPRLLSWTGAMGRMSLTVYLSQSLMLSLIFGGWGLGLYQQLPYWGAVLTAVAVTVFLAVVSRLWLTKFRQGPMEKLLSRWSKLGIESRH